MCGIVHSSCPGFVLDWRHLRLGYHNRPSILCAVQGFVLFTSQTAVVKTNRLTRQRFKTNNPQDFLQKSVTSRVRRTRLKDTYV